MGTSISPPSSHALKTKRVIRLTELTRINNEMDRLPRKCIACMGMATHRYLCRHWAIWHTAYTSMFHMSDVNILLLDCRSACMGIFYTGFQPSWAFTEII